jgi:hypothetical protein
MEAANIAKCVIGIKTKAKYLKYFDLGKKAVNSTEQPMVTTRVVIAKVVRDAASLFI